MASFRDPLHLSPGLNTAVEYRDLARTVADLAAAEPIRPEHIAEAIQYRTLDHNFWQ